MPAWIAVGGIAVLASIYTALDRLCNVAVTDMLQFVVMTLGALIIWYFVSTRYRVGKAWTQDLWLKAKTLKMKC